MDALKLATRMLLSVVIGVATFLATMTAYCNDVGGVPSWERCRSWLGNPMVEWPGGNASPLFALALGIGAGCVAWWLLGKTPLHR